MSGTNGQHADGFALLEAHHVDDLIDCMRNLRVTLMALDKTIQAQTLSMIEQRRVTEFSAATIERIERIESRLDKAIPKPRTRKK